MQDLMVTDLEIVEDNQRCQCA